MEEGKFKIDANHFFSFVQGANFLNFPDLFCLNFLLSLTFINYYVTMTGDMGSPYLVFIEMFPSKVKD